MKYNYNKKGEYVGSTEVTLEGFDATDTEPKGLASPIWDGKGWTEAKAGEPYANFADYGFATALDYAKADAAGRLAGADKQVANSIPLQVTLDATAQTIVSIEGGTADQKKLDAFSTAMTKRTGDISTLAASSVNLASAKDVKAVSAVLDEINAVLAKL